MTKKVSIVIPMYNESRYIGRCLDSLLKQSYKDFEIILIDDGSKDNTVKIAEGYKNKCDLTVLQQKNSGPGKARNRGAKEAKGDIFVFVDADMYFDKKYIENLIDPILKGEEKGTTHGTEKIGNPENIRAKSRGLDRIPYPQKRSGVYRAISKKAFFESGGYNTDRFAFEDDIGSKSGKMALTIMDAICYHNNPENLKEVFKHEKWMGESTIAKGKIYKYIRRFSKYIALMIIFLGIGICFLIKSNISFIGVITTSLALLIIFCEIMAIKRIIKEKELRYLFAIPILSITRGLGYIRGMIKYLFIRK